VADLFEFVQRRGADSLGRGVGVMRADTPSPPPAQAGRTPHRNDWVIEDIVAVVVEVEFSRS
jgi:hypothetical protein